MNQSEDKNKNYSIVIKSLNDNNLTEYDKEIFNMFENIKTQNMLQGKYCDSSLRGNPWYLSINYNNDRNIDQKKNIDEINTLLKESPNNKNLSKKQQNLDNKKFIDLINKLND